MAITLYKQNTHTLILPNVRDAINEAQRIDNAAVTGVLYDSKLATVPPLDNMVFTSMGGNGAYTYEVPDTFDPPEGNYTLVLDVRANGKRYHKEIAVAVKVLRG